MGVLIRSGHDPDRLLEYTPEQLELWAQCVVQSKLTDLRVLAFAVGGSDAEARTPKGSAPGAPKKPGGRESLLSEAEEFALKTTALQKLGVLQKKVAEFVQRGGGKPAPPSARPVPATPQGVSDLQARLNAATSKARGES